MLLVDVLYIWLGLIFLASASVSVVGWWAYRSYLKLEEQLAATREQLAHKEEKEREELVKKLRLRRANILLQPVQSIAPPNLASEDHIIDGELSLTQTSSFDGKGYLWQMNELPYSSPLNNPDIYHSVRPFEYWKYYQNQQEGANSENEYHGYSRPQQVDSESLTNPLTTQHSINWNYRFQNCIRRLRAVQDSSETLRAREEANIDLLHLAQDFVDAATSYGKIIISEHFLPHEKKTIQPQSLPGIIGGEKFVVHNILFKFAVDHKNIYGSDFSAAKAAGNELRGLMCYFNTGILDINVPLMALVDYRGFRLTAMSLLPVDTSTIIYGTFDAGKTIHYSQDDVFNTKMRTASEMMRLRPHLCRQQAPAHAHAGMDSPQGFGRRIGSAGGIGGIGATGAAGASSSGFSVAGPGFEGFALYERERTPLLLTHQRPGLSSKVFSHGATDELQLVTEGGLLVHRRPSTATEHSSSPSHLSPSVSPSSPPSVSSATVPSSPFNMNTSFNNQLIYSAVDLEGHKGLDGKYYLLDFSRVLPPESPNRMFQNPHLSRLLRPEFLKVYDKLLCSDAFSGFIQGTPDEDEITADVHEATRYLRETHIPKMAMRIYEMMKETRLEKPLEKFRLTEAMHAMGINCRYAGIVRKHIKDPECRKFILAEVVARAIKNNLRWRLREQHQLLKLPLEEPYLRLVIDYLNLVFGNTPKSDEYWDTFLKKDIMHNFEAVLTHEEETSPNFHLKARFLDPLLNSPGGNPTGSVQETPQPDWLASVGSSPTSPSSQGKQSPKSSSSSSSDLARSRSDPNSLQTSRDSLSSLDGPNGAASGLVTRRQDSPMQPLRGSTSSAGSVSRDAIRASASPISPSYHIHRRHSSIPRPLEGGSEEGANGHTGASEHLHTASTSSSGSSAFGRNPARHGRLESNGSLESTDSQNESSFASWTPNIWMFGAGGAPISMAHRLDHDFLTIVFNRVKAMLGLQFTHDRHYSWDMETPFNDTDLKNVGYKVKHMNIISHVQGFFWQINGLMARSSTVTGLAQDYYKAAIDKYEEALDLNPENKDILRNLALTWLLLIEEDRKPGQPFPVDDRRVQKVHEYIMRAISAPPKYDSLSLFRYANLLSRLNKKEEAEDYYLQSLEADPNNTGCLHEYGDFLTSEGLDDDAEKFYKRSSDTTAGASRFPENFY
jgi:hypothetical protein